MADIFISYKREEHTTAKKLADSLQEKGWTVWWDPEVRAGERFDDVIEKALIESKCVVVLWSKLSVNSQNVKDEATYALNRDKLVPIVIEEVDLPFRFERINTGQLIDWDGSDNFPGFQKLIADVISILGEPPAEEQKRQREEAERKAEKERRRKQEQERQLREDEQRKAEEERQRLEQEKQRLAEEKRKFEEEQKRLEAARKAEEERKQKEAEAADDEKRRKEEEELKRKTEEDERKRKEAEVKRKTEEEQKSRAVKEESKSGKPEPEAISPSEPRKTSDALKFGVVAGVIVLLITAVGFYYKYQQEQQKKETRIKLEQFYEQVEALERAVAKFNNQKQLKELYRQRDTLSHQVEVFSEQATKVGLGSQLQELQNRLKQVQIQKEPLFKIEGFHKQVWELEDAVAKVDNQEQLIELYKQRDTLSQQVEGLSEQATKVGLESLLKQLQNRIKLIQQHFANKERELSADKRGRIFVEFVPNNAIVRILNIEQGFRQGMELKPGKYHIEVSLRDYESQNRWVDLGVGEEKRISFKLEKIKSEKPTSHQKAITNSIGMKFVLIQAGGFTMGSQLSPEEVVRRYGGEAKWYKNEQPQHTVEITKPFYLQTAEVSQAQWEKVMGDKPSYFKDCGDNCPVERVSWYMAQKFISKLNQMEGTNKYRLPTEAEWEYACRAGTTTVFSFGNGVDKLGEYAWYSDNSKGKTKPVGKKKPNAWGLYDMHGNVWEWCHDWYGDYPSNSVVDPKGPDNGEYRVLRGGSWDHFAWHLRSAIRNRYNPIFYDIDYGFRVARDF